MLQNKKINMLVNICKVTQGEYFSSGHPKTSWATTYSKEFIEASANLYFILSNKYSTPLIELSNIFLTHNIKSCRGSPMTLDRVSYLFHSHIKSLVSMKLNDIKICEYCNKRIKDLILHVSQKHPNKWNEFSIWHGEKVYFYIGGNKRCDSCGNFVKNHDIHKEKCTSNIKMNNT